MKGRLWIVIALFGAVDLAVSWQEPQKNPGSTLSVRTQMVQVYLRVTEGGQAIPGLTPADLSLFEDTRRKEIANLSSGEDPLHVALLLDISDSMRPVLPVTKEAAVSFVEALQPQDRVTLVSFSSDIRYVAQQSDDRNPIVRAIRESGERGETKLHEAILFAMKYLANRRERRAVVIFSDGEDTARGASLDLVLNAAGRYGFPIYTVGAGAGIEQEELKRVLRRLAEINGGKTYSVEDPRQLRSVFLGIAAELRSAYVLTYYTGVPADGRWHDIEIRASNPRFNIQSRKGFYAQSAGPSSLFSGASGANATVPSDQGLRSWKDDEFSGQAVKKILEPTPDVRAVDATQTAAAGTQSSAPVFKVESQFVEIPVLLESEASQIIPELSQKDFRIYEDDVLQELAFFAKADEPQSISRLRDEAMARIGKAKAPAGVAATPASELEALVLGRYYLVLDNLMTEAGAYLQAKIAAEKMIRSYSSPVRPMSVYFTSEGQSPADAGDNPEAMLERIRRSMPGSTQTSTAGIMTVHEAYLIESGDIKARQLAELQLAQSMDLRYQNALGEVDGDMAADAKSVTAEIESHSRELIAQHFSQVSRTLSGLRTVIALAAADPGRYPKTVIFISSGFSLGRISGRADASGQMNLIVQAAKRAGLRVYTIDATGLDAAVSVDISRSGSLFAHNPFLAPIFEDHAQGWRREKESSLSQLATDTGGRFLHSTNDLVAGVGKVIRNTGRLYYVGYLSRQPADGQYHRIRVSVSARSARVHARNGYFAGRQSASAEVGQEGFGAEDVPGLVARADAARKTGDHRQLALIYDRMVRRNPGDANEWYNLGVAWLRARDFERAVQALRTAFSLSPDDQEIGRVLARAFVESGSREAAAATLEQMLRRFPRDTQTLMQLGLVYESTGQPAEAYNVYRKVLDLTLKPPHELSISLIRTAVRLGRVAEAHILIEDFLARGGSEAELKPFRDRLSQIQR